MFAEINSGWTIMFVFIGGFIIQLVIQKNVDDEKRRRRFITLVYLVMTIIFLTFALLAYLSR